MSVEIFNPSDRPRDDANWRVAHRLVGAFAPHAQAIPTMVVALDQGWLLNGTTLTEVPGQTVGPFAAPISGYRVDRIVVDRTTGIAAMVTGSGNTPTPPAIPVGTLPVARIVLRDDTLAITNALLFDERAFTDQTPALNATLTALGALDGTPGLVEQTGAASFAKRALGTDASGSVPTTGDADARYLQLTGGTLSGTLTLAGDPATALEAAPRRYVDGAIAAITPASIGAATASVTVTGAGILTGGGDLTADRVIVAADVAQNTLLGRTSAGIGAPSALDAPMVGVVAAADAAAARAVLALGDAATRSVGTGSALDLPDLAAADARYLRLSGGTLTGSLTLPGDPEAALDAATKQYVDTVAQGLTIKPSVKAASTGPLVLSGVQSVDGVALSAGDRCLVKNQAAPAENGLYLVAAGDWTRTADMNAWSEVPGAFVFIEQGATLADGGWVCTADSGGTLGSTPITWSQFAGVGAYVPLSRRILAGTGLDGGGDLSADRTLSLADTTVTAGSYGSGTAVATFTVDAQGRLTAAGMTTVTPAGIGAASSSVTVTGTGILAGGGTLAADRTITAADVAQNTLLGRTAAGTGAPSPLSTPMVGVVTAADADAARAVLGVSIGSDVQAYDSDLAAVAGLSATGLVARTGSGTAAARTITGSGIVTVTNGDGVSGNPTVATSMTTNRLLGRSTTGTGAVEEILLGTGLSLSGGTLTAAAGGLPVVTVTGTSQALAANTAYIADNAARVTFTLPATTAAGDRFAIVGKGAGGWRIDQNAGQVVRYDTTSSSVGTSDGIQSDNPQSSVEIVCIAANTTFTVVNRNATISRWGANGYITGDAAATINRLTFVNEAVTALASSLSSTIVAPYSGNSTSKGYILGGYRSGAGSSLITGLAFSTEANANIAATLAVNNCGGADLNSGTTCYACGGQEPSTAAICALTYATEATSTLSHSLPVILADAAGMSGSLAGYIAGNGGPSAAIIKTAWATETPVTLSATLDTARVYNAAMNSLSKGYTAGGWMAGAVPIASIEDMDFSTDTSAAISATLDTAVLQGNAVNGSAKGYWTGGQSSGGTINTIDDMNFATETSARISATLTVAMRFGANFQSGGYL